MKHRYLTILAGAAAICLTGSAFAQSYDADRQNRTLNRQQQEAGAYSAIEPWAGVGTRGLGLTAPQTRALQHELDLRGYPVGPIDGIFGSRTEEALREFQQNIGLAVTGRPNSASTASPLDHRAPGRR